MDDAAAVREPDRLANLEEHPEVPGEQVHHAVAGLHGLVGLSHHVAPRPAFDALEHDLWPPVVRHGDVVNGDDVWVLQLAHEVGLFEQQVAR